MPWYVLPEYAARKVGVEPNTVVLCTAPVTDKDGTYVEEVRTADGDEVIARNVSFDDWQKTARPS